MDIFTCRDCKQVLPVTESLRDKGRKSGIMERCRPCGRVRAKAYRTDPRYEEVQRERVRLAMERIRAEGRELPLTEEQQEQKRTYNRELMRKLSYAKKGVTDADYWRMFKAQNGLCAICGTDDPRFKAKDDSPVRFAVDHCHDTGRIRGLLCRHCNLALGYMGDDPNRLRVAAVYLELT